MGLAGYLQLGCSRLNRSFASLTLACSIHNLACRFCCLQDRATISGPLSPAAQPIPTTPFASFATCPCRHVGCPHQYCNIAFPQRCHQREHGSRTQAHAHMHTHCLEQACPVCVAILHNAQLGTGATMLTCAATTACTPAKPRAEQSSLEQPAISRAACVLPGLSSWEGRICSVACLRQPPSKVGSIDMVKHGTPTPATTTPHMQAFHANAFPVSCAQRKATVAFRCC